MADTLLSHDSFFSSFLLPCSLSLSSHGEGDCEKQQETGRAQKRDVVVLVLASKAEMAMLNDNLNKFN